jgi:putative ABC transport system permease protein
VRLALGAGRVRLLRQFAAEGVVVGAGALALGWLLTPVLTAFIVGRLPAEVTAGQALQPDWRTFAFASLTSVVGIVLLALLPAELVRRAEPAVLFRAGTPVRTRFGVVGVRSFMLVAQLAVTAALVYMAGLAQHRFARVTSVDLGFTPRGLVAVPLPYVTVNGALKGEALRADLQRQVALEDEAPGLVRQLPWIQSATSASLYPLQGANVLDATLVAAADPQRTEEPVRSLFVGEDYARTIGVKVAQGRDLQPHELADSALVNTALAHELSRFGPVLGQAVTAARKTWRIVGVVADFVDERPDEPVRPELFCFDPGAPYLLARLAPGADARAGEIQALVVKMWGDRPRPLVVHLDEAARRATADYRARSILLAAIALLSLPLAVAGFAGTLSYVTQQRTREIAIRLALGAEPGAIHRRVVGRALALAACGLALGLGAGVLIGRLMSGYLFGVRAADFATVAAVSVVLLASGWIAATVPAGRAARIQPSAALREP